ncbi:uncharacterized protein LOC123318665 [Coccinella septempunctata]|uniref:uncharacterized protein LOC123318665 n=1 Tax=Coccinella septempunctata TaxID=41139 RepID=UPI001D084BDF|nr:uncharacterized protein LOC123318665 [Coccinella septempunctata]
MSNILNEVSKLFKIKQINCTAYHPQSNGALERSHQTLADYLRHYINENQSDWDCWIDFAMFSYNTTTHSSTKFSPHELLFGKQPQIPTSLTNSVDFKYTYENYVDELKLKLQKSQEIARNNILKSKETSKIYYDKKSRNTEFKLGEKVLLLNEKSEKGKSKKLSQQYTGPYEIIEINSPVNVTIQIKRRKVKVHTNRLKHFTTPVIMTPYQLVAELSKTITYIKNANVYPYSLSKDNANRFLDIIEIKYHVSDNRIVYVISIPLVNSMKYSLYNLVPLPILHSSKESFVFILPAIKFLALSEILNTYTTFNDVNHCKSLDENEIMCIPEEPIYLTQSRKICETQLLTADSTSGKLDPSCDTRVLPASYEIWHKLTSNNSWIFALPQQTSITLNCLPNSPLSLFINGTGIITLDGGCKLYTSTTTIASDPITVKQTIFKEPIFPNFDLLQDCCEKFNDKPKIPNETLHIIPIQSIGLDYNELNIASQKLDEMNVEATRIIVMKSTVISYLVCTAIKCILAYLMYKLIKYLYKKYGTQSDKKPLGICHKSFEEESLGNCCQKITNCLTFNIKSRSKSPVRVQYDEENIATEEIPLRRSPRIAQLKDQ